MLQSLFCVSVKINALLNGAFVRREENKAAGDKAHNQTADLALASRAMIVLEAVTDVSHRTQRARFCTITPHYNMPGGKTGVEAQTALCHVSSKAI